MSLRRKDVTRPSGECDAAVEVRAAVFEKGSTRFSLEPIGYPSVADKGHRKARCGEVPGEISLSILDFGPDEAVDQIASEVGKILQTPEAYLAAHGIAFDRPPVADEKLVADLRPTSEAEERNLARAVTGWQQRLLSVEPFYRDPARRVRHEGEVEVLAVVGSDGRLHQPRILTPLGGHEGRVLRVLPLWRYEPARRGERPVPARVVERTVIRIF